MKALLKCLCDFSSRTQFLNLMLSLITKVPQKKKKIIKQNLFQNFVIQMFLNITVLIQICLTITVLIQIA